MTMKKLLGASTVVAALLTAAPAMAGSVYADAALLAMIESVNVVVVDHVKDGCLLNASEIEARLSATLERSGIHVAETSRWYLHVSLIGRPTIHGGRREGCVVDSYYQLTSYGPANTRIVAGDGGFLSIGPDAQDSATMQSIEGFADEVIAAILAARQSAGAGVSGRQS
jgi:hypothetical protein